MGGASGLCYASVWATLADLGLRPRRQRECFAAIQGMERAALTVFEARAEQQRRARS